MGATELSGCAAGLAFEHDAEILRMLKSGAYRDLCEGEVRIDEQSLHAIDPDAHYFFPDSVAQALPESFLEHLAGQRYRAQHVRYVYCLACVLPDESHGFDNSRVVDGECVGGLPLFDAERSYTDFGDRRTLAFHDLRQKGRRLIAGAPGIRNYTRQPRGSQLAKQFVVVDAQDRNFIRHCEFGIAAGIQDLLAP
ncbi:MAG TPA: hypothetical protein VHH12_08275, partial [Mycobacterium sp.]|nr:hypothetical protein [Mycobacterium sp.]